MEESLSQAISDEKTKKEKNQDAIYNLAVPDRGMSLDYGSRGTRKPACWIGLGSLLPEADFLGASWIMLELA